MSLLKPCPFCGSTEAYLRRSTDQDDCTFVHVECRNCRAKSADKWFSRGNDCPLFYQEIRDAWNNRPGMENFE